MNIEMDGAHKSTVTCWRELLRHLNTLRPCDLSGGKYNNLTQTNFVEFGSNNSELMDDILHFMLSDLPVDIETRTEIFLNNLKDAVCLKLFDQPPDHVFVQTEDPKSKESLEQQIADIRLQLKEIKLNILLLDPDEYTHKVKEMHKKEILEEHITRFEKDLRKISLGVLEKPYIAWVINRLLEKSALDCQQIIDASNRLSHSSFSQMHRTYLTTVAVELQSEVNSTPSVHKTSI